MMTSSLNFKNVCLGTERISVLNGFITDFSDALWRHKIFSTFTEKIEKREKRKGTRRKSEKQRETGRESEREREGKRQEEKAKVKEKRRRRKKVLTDDVIISHLRSFTAPGHRSFDIAP